MVAAAKADVLSLTAFEVGLFGWMADGLAGECLADPARHQGGDVAGFRPAAVADTR